MREKSRKQDVSTSVFGSSGSAVTPVGVAHSIRMLLPESVHKSLIEKIGHKRCSFLVCESCAFLVALDTTTALNSGFGDTLC